MKNPTKLVLLLAGAALLAGCDDDKKSAQNSQPPPGQQKIYKDLDACLAEARDMDGVQSCRAGYQQALAQMAEAPRYDERARCEDVYGPGNCVPRGAYVHDGGGGFIPFMMGYMLGGGLGGGRTVYQPVFIDRSGAAHAGSSVISTPRWSGGDPPPRPAAASPTSIKRGGFGSSAGARARVGS
jgi:uncharacterized protein YgiB involved in biofilm formation